MKTNTKYLSEFISETTASSNDQQISHPTDSPEQRLETQK